jgi:PKD repeat protein
MALRRIRISALVAVLAAMFAPAVLGAAPTAAAAPTATAAATATATGAAAYQGPASFVPLRSAAKGAALHTGASAAPFDTALSNLDYNGGPLMPTNTDYIVFWSPKGLGAYGPGAPPQYTTGLQQYFTDLAHDSGGRQNVDSVATQYNDLTGASARYAVTFGGALLDTDPYPASLCPVNAPVTHCLTDDQIQHELEKVASAHHLKRDFSHEFFLMTPPHVENCFSGNASDNPPFAGCSAGEVPSTLAFYCAYHQNTSIAPMLLYSNDPYVVGNPGCDDGNHPNGPSDGALVGGLSHEHNESITDPMPNDAWTNGAGPNHGLENGDQCDGQMGTPLGAAANGASYNQVINGHFYWYQEEWSNQGHTCLQRLPVSERKPKATFTVSAGSGLTLNFDATGSSASGGVAHYIWQFNDAFGTDTVEQTTPKISHTFPAAGAYSIGLTVAGADGVSTGAGGIARTGHAGFTPGFTVSTARPAKGQQVKFAAITSVSNQPVITYHWEFGDGTIASTGQATHTYLKAGTYTVKLVMFSGTGSAFPGAGAGPVSTRQLTVH